MIWVRGLGDEANGMAPTRTHCSAALSLRKKKVAQRTSSKALEEFLLPVRYGVVRQQYNGICSTNFQGYGYVPLCGILPSARRKFEIKNIPNPGQRRIIITDSSMNLI